jgi:hypothetical protein
MVRITTPQKARAPTPGSIGHQRGESEYVVTAPSTGTELYR